MVRARRKERTKDTVYDSYIERKKASIERAVTKYFGKDVRVIEDDVGRKTYIVNGNLYMQFNSVKEVRDMSEMIINIARKGDINDNKKDGLK